MNPKKKSRRYRVSVSIHALDLAIYRFTHSLGWNRRKKNCGAVIILQISSQHHCQQVKKTQFELCALLAIALPIANNCTKWHARENFKELSRARTGNWRNPQKISAPFLLMKTHRIAIISARSILLGNILHFQAILTFLFGF
jgi:hypothetical protein